MNSFGRTSTILGKEVEEHVLEDVRVRAGYLLGNLFVLLIQKQYILSNFFLSVYFTFLPSSLYAFSCFLSSILFNFL